MRTHTCDPSSIGKYPSQKYCLHNIWYNHPNPSHNLPSFIYFVFLIVIHHHNQIKLNIYKGYIYRKMCKSNNSNSK